MTRRPDHDAVRNTVAYALACDPAVMDAGSGLGSHPDWDSLTHLSVILAIEKAFELSVPDDDVPLLVSLGAIEMYLLNTYQEGPQ